MKHSLLVVSLSALAALAVAASPGPSHRVFDRSSASTEDALPGREDCNSNGIPDDVETTVEFTYHDLSNPADAARSVVTADLDGDGDPDVLTTSFDDEIAWYENLDGAANFGVRQIISTTMGNPRDAIAADVDTDGDLDVLAAGLTPKKVVWHENIDGAGTFGPEQIITTAYTPQSIAAGDLDGDGDVDLVIPSDALPDIVWLENVDGAGNFGAPQPIVSGYPSRMVFLADVDGDSDLDVVSDLRIYVAWHENLDGAGTFGEPRIVSAEIRWGHAVAAADIDGDSDIDVFSASWGLNIAWYKNLDGLGDFGPGSGPYSQVNPTDLFAIDIDGDGDTDLASGDQNGLTWWENSDGAGSFVAHPIPTSLVYDVVGDDLDGDGDVDILTGGYDFGWYENLSGDCNGNAVPDECDITAGTSLDCDGNQVPDECDVATGAAEDCNDNGTPDGCESGFDDCDSDGVPDECSADCNSNSNPDVCDVFTGSSDDCNGNEIPDECEPDCNSNGVADACDVVFGASLDCSGNGVPDECEVDCNDNEIPDVCDIVGGASTDCTGNGVPDECEPDCNGNAIPDSCELSVDFSKHTVATIAAYESAVADLEEDGDQDIVSCTAGGLAWYENTDGLGTFGSGQLISDLGCGDVQAADVDGDRDIDVLASSSSILVWYENLDGLGTFGPQQFIATVSGGNQSGTFIVFDVDLDVDPDIVCAIGNLLLWFENTDGNGTFGAAQEIDSSSSSQRVPLHSADLNGDGLEDLIATPYVTWYENLGGAFGPRQRVSEGSEQSAGSGIPVDIEGDGDLDLAGIRWSENINGLGSFGPSQSVGQVYEFGDGWGARIDAADIDGDGDGDVVVASPTHDGPDGVVWFENLDGRGFFGPAHTIDSPDQGSYRDVLAVDLDGDRKVDVHIAHYTGLFWYRNENGDCDANGVPDECDPDCDADGLPDACEPDCNDNGTPDDCDIAAGASLDCTGNGIPDECDIASGASQDINGNGIPDECEADCNENGILDDIDIGPGYSIDCDANGVPDECDTVVAFAQTVIDPDSLFGDSSVGDVDGDGDLDFYIRAGQGFSWFENIDGAGTFGPEQVVDPSVSGTHTSRAIDLDADEDADLLLGGTNGISWYESDGGVFGAPSLVNALETEAVYGGDVDGDGYNDIVAGHPGGEIAWYRNLGNGTFAGPLSVADAHPPGVDSVPAIEGVDFDDDGLLDLVFSAYSDLYWSRNLDGLNFEPEAQIGDGGDEIAIADVDGDGDSDIVQRDNNELTWFEFQGLASGFVEHVIVIVPDLARTMSVADVDADADVDLVFGDTFYDAVMWCENLDGAGTFGSAQVLFDADSPSVWTADLDRDGDVDMLVESAGISLYENTSDDCDGNGVPNSCEPDCNDNGLADGCELRSFEAFDCNGNFVPDDCDVGPAGAGDADGDGCLDGVDSAPNDPNVCGDGDGDGCEDCSGGSHDPLNDGPDTDFDGICDSGDCMLADGAVWSRSSSITTLALERPGSDAKLTWLPPASPGADDVVYDTLSSSFASDFHAPATCLDSDEVDRVTIDGAVPMPGEVFFYLIRVENDCPFIPGNMGADSTGQLRSGVSCP